MKTTFKSRVINLFAGPGSGKSTLAAGLFSLLKLDGVVCELVTEYAKDLLWEGRLGRTHRYDILINQYNRLARLDGKVEWIITDSPLLLPGIYNQKVAPLASELYHEFNNDNWYVDRVKPYQPIGRRESEDSARSVDHKIKCYLHTHNYTYGSITGNAAGLQELYTSYREVIHGLPAMKGE